MKKYNSIDRLGKNTGILGGGPLYIQEKIDGANFRFRVNRDQEISFGTKNIDYGPVELNPIPDYKDSIKHSLFKYSGGLVGEKWNPLGSVDRRFLHAIEHIHGSVSSEDIIAAQHQYVGGDRLMFFGEATNDHIMNYEDSIPSFLGFDVYNLDGDYWLTPDEMQEIFGFLGLETVPRINVMRADEFNLENFEFPDSEFLSAEVDDEEPRIEGIVLRNTELGLRAKYRTERFKEVHGNMGNDGNVAADSPEQMNGVYGKQTTQYNSSWLAQKFVTRGRVEKHILKLRDRGHDIEMSMMPELKDEVYADVIEEEYDEILTQGNFTFNVRDFRSEAASRCANYLSAFMERRANNPDESPEDLMVIQNE